VRRSRRNERLNEPSNGAAAAAKNAEARGFRPGNRDFLDLLGKDSAAPEMAELEQAAAALPSATADPGAGAAAARTPRTPPDVPLTGARAEALTGALGSSQSVPPQVRGPMEQILGRDLSGVEVFQGAAAAAKASEEGAEAFTLGESIVLGGGFQPGTLFGDALLAHELAHVAHQSEGGPASAAPESQLENEADLSAAALVAKLVGAQASQRDAAPRSRSGLRMQRCAGCGGKSVKKETAQKVEEAAKKPEEQKQEAETEENPCPVGPDAEAVEAAAEKLKNAYSLSAVTAADGSCWTVAELEKVEKAMGRMSADQRTALQGVELRRVATANCAGHSADGCFTAAADSSGNRADRLEMGDFAFSKDKDFDEGFAHTLGPNGERLDLKPSEETFLHEAGHAVESAEERAAEGPRIVAKTATDKAQDDLNAAIKAFLDASPPARSFPATSNAADAAYVRSIIVWVEALQKVTQPTDALFAIAAPTLANYDAAITAVAGHIQTTQAARKDLSAKAKAAGASVRNATAESELAAAQTAAEDILAKLKARRAAEETFNKAKAAERAVKASIPLATGAAPTDMSRRLADFVALLAVLGIDPKQHEGIAPYGTQNWPEHPDELFADYYELSRTRPAYLEGLDSEVAAFFNDPIGVKDKAVKKKVDAWIKTRS
jgi:hypothetical protein